MFFSCQILFSRYASDLNLKNRFPEASKRLPDAYERLILDVVKSDHSLFVRSDELRASWKIFTPLLLTLEEKQIKPIIYEYGSRGPQEGDDLIKRYGFVRNENYKWTDKSLSGMHNKL